MKRFRTKPSHGGVALLNVGIAGWLELKLTRRQKMLKPFKDFANDTTANISIEIDFFFFKFSSDVVHQIPLPTAKQYTITGFQLFLVQSFLLWCHISRNATTKPRSLPSSHCKSLANDLLSVIPRQQPQFYSSPNPNRISNSFNFVCLFVCVQLMSFAFHNTESEKKKKGMEKESGNVLDAPAGWWIK